jgi:hypothetical protein
MERGDLARLEIPFTLPSLSFRSGVDVVATADDAEVHSKTEG